MTPNALLVYAVARELGYRAQGEPFRLLYPEVARRAGWGRTTAPATVRRRCGDSLAALAGVGLLSYERAHHDGLTAVDARLPEDRGAFEQLPREVLAVLTGPEAREAAAPLAWLYVVTRREVLRSGGVARLSVQDMATRAGMGRTVTRRLRQELMRLGALHVCEPSGVVPLVSLEPLADTPATPTEIPPPPLPESAHHPYRNLHIQ